MASDFTSDLELSDAEKVDTAIEALKSGRLDEAERILLRVVANTPAHYANSCTDDQWVGVKFWDQTEFLHYIAWQRDHGHGDQSVRWLSNAYPRAYYYLGFLSVKRKQIGKAMEYLEKGHTLEPTNPHFILEKAKALVQAGCKHEAIGLYDQLSETSAHIHQRHLAMAKRGRGFVLIELGDLDQAEVAFKASLKLDPENQVAVNELQYIDHLRKGGSAAQAQSVRVPGADLSVCVVCAQTFEKGIAITLDGMPAVVCSRCQRKLTKKWWQFWK